jgi:hypothetical protein
VGLDGQLHLLVDLFEGVALDDGREELDKVVLQPGSRVQSFNEG